MPSKNHPADAPPPLHFDTLGPDVPVTAGIDLAARAKNTAACEIAWPTGGLGVRWLNTPGDTDDDGLLELIRRSSAVGLDCPLGWPEAYTDLVSAHTAGAPLPTARLHTAHTDGRALDPLQYRLTDDATWKALNATGRRVRPPLSVSTNLLGVVALRAARLLDQVWGVDRSGTGRIAEVYPAASLRFWNIDIDSESYKKPGATKAREKILDALADGLHTRLDGVTITLCTKDSDHLDAFVAALAARAVSLGLTTSPQPGEQQRLAQIEGWIHLPTGPLSALLA